MALTQTPLCNFGWKAKGFSLKGVDGKVYKLDDIKGKNGTLIMFICNHCPYVQGIITPLVADVKKLQDQGIGVVAISANDAINYPVDSFDNMKIFARQHNFNFPYLYDESQDVARSYDAVCTPDFFGFNQDLALQYRGRFDSSRDKTTPFKHELLDAMQQVVKTGEGPKQQLPSMGCNIKWKAG